MSLGSHSTKSEFIREALEAALETLEHLSLDNQEDRAKALTAIWQATMAALVDWDCMYD